MPRSLCDMNFTAPSYCDRPKPATRARPPPPPVDFLRAQTSRLRRPSRRNYEPLSLRPRLRGRAPPARPVSEPDPAEDSGGRVFAADDDVHGQTCVILGAPFISTRLRGSVVAASFSGSRRRSPAPPGRLTDSEAAKTHLGSNHQLSPSGDPLLDLPPSALRWRAWSCGRRLTPAKIARTVFEKAP